MTQLVEMAPPDVALDAWERAEAERQRAAEAERSAYEAWQEAYAAYELLRDETDQAHRRYRALAAS